jgi:hypothetical protein
MKLFWREKKEKSEQESYHIDQDIDNKDKCNKFFIRID